MALIKYPYTNLHEINLDWLIEKVEKCYSPDNPPDMAVLSVNGMTGDVTLYTDPVVTFPAIQGNSWNIGRTAGGTNVGIKFNKTLPAQRVNGTSLFNIYDEGNPPPYPVTSVNGQTGAVQVQEAFFSLTGNTITFITDAPGHFWALDRATQDGSISLKLDTTNNTPSAYLEYLSADETVSRSIKLLTPDDIPSSSGVVSVNGMAGVVSLTAEDVPRSGSVSENVNHALNALEADAQAIHEDIGNVGATSLQSQVNDINTKIGNVGNTPLQTQVDNVNTKIGTVGNTPLQNQVDTINTKIGTVGNTPLQNQVDALNSQIGNFKAEASAVAVEANSSVNITIDATSGAYMIFVSRPGRTKTGVFIADSSGTSELVYCGASVALSGNTITVANSNQYTMYVTVYRMAM